LRGPALESPPEPPQAERDLPLRLLQVWAAARPVPASLPALPLQVAESRRAPASQQPVQAAVQAVPVSAPVLAQRQASRERSAQALAVAPGQGQAVLAQSPPGQQPPVPAAAEQGYSR
jgi:hypothetical protein